MSAVTNPKGPLPSRVYWLRRGIVIVVALLLVFGVARLLGMGSDGSSADDKAAQTSGDIAPSGSATPTETGEPSESATPEESESPTESGSAAPSAVCADEDILVNPTVRSAVAGADRIRIGLELRTATADACTWRVSPRTLVLKVTSGSDAIWSSQQCKTAVPRQDVVVQQDKSTRVNVIWNGKRSDEECSKYTGWAMPGWYHVTAAALGGNPTDVQFQLQSPQRPTVAPEPRERDREKQKRPSEEPSEEPRTNMPTAPTEEPREDGSGGAQEPNG